MERDGAALIARKHKSRIVRPKQPRLSHASLESRREALLRRMEVLAPAAKTANGYRAARTLLGSKYIRASLAARVGLVEAADFLIKVLEMIPPI